MESPWFAYKPQINETMLDVMCHLNHARYLMLYEDARWQHFHDHGYTLEYMQKHGKGFVMIDAYVTYLREVKHREDITIRTRFLNMTKKVWTIQQEMIRTDGAQASTIVLKAGVFDLNLRKLTSMDPERLKAFVQTMAPAT